MTPNCDARDQETLKITSHINIDFLTLLNTCYCISFKEVKLPIFLVLHSKKKIKDKKETVEKMPI